MQYGPRQANLVLIAYASSEGSGEPAHPRSLARTFAARSYKQWVKRNLQTESQIPGPSEWLDMRSWNLSWRNARRHKFAWRGSYKTLNTLFPPLNQLNVAKSYLFMKLPISESFVYLACMMYQSIAWKTMMYRVTGCVLGRPTNLDNNRAVLGYSAYMRPWSAPICHVFYNVRPWPSILPFKNILYLSVFDYLLTYIYLQSRWRIQDNKA